MRDGRSHRIRGQYVGQPGFAGLAAAVAGGGGRPRLAHAAPGSDQERDPQAGFAGLRALPDLARDSRAQRTY